MMNTEMNPRLLVHGPVSSATGLSFSLLVELLAKLLVELLAELLDNPPSNSVVYYPMHLVQ